MAQSSHPVPSLPLKPSSRSWCPVIAPAADSSNLDNHTIISDNNNTKQLYQQKQTTTTTTTVTKGITPTTTTVMPARTTKCQCEQQNASAKNFLASTWPGQSGEVRTKSCHWWWRGRPEKCHTYIYDIYLHISLIYIYIYCLLIWNVNVKVKIIRSYVSPIVKNVNSEVRPIRRR